MSEPQPPEHLKRSLLRPLEPQQTPLYKQRSWSPDAYRDEAWLLRKKKNLRKRSKSVTEEDVDELKACIELGFGFDSPDVDQRLSHTLPALELYYAVNKNYNDSVSKPTTFLTSSSSSVASDCDTSSPLDSPHTMIAPGDNPQTVKTRLRQWAQVVACSVQQFSSS